jgi:hypothetical protein
VRPRTPLHDSNSTVRSQNRLPGAHPVHGSLPIYVMAGSYTSMLFSKRIRESFRALKSRPRQSTQALERGTDGVVLRTENPADVFAIKVGFNSSFTWVVIVTESRTFLTIAIMTPILNREELGSSRKAVVFKEVFLAHLVICEGISALSLRLPHLGVDLDDI